MITATIRFQTSHKDKWFWYIHILPILMLRFKRLKGNVLHLRILCLLPRTNELNGLRAINITVWSFLYRWYCVNFLYLAVTFVNINCYTFFLCPTHYLLFYSICTFFYERATWLKYNYQPSEIYVCDIWYLYYTLIKSYN